MRRQGLPKRAGAQLRRAEAQTFPLPSPIGGLNTRDSWAAMPPIDAIELVNWIPQQGGLKVRSGYSIATSSADFVFVDTNDFVFVDTNDFVFAENTLYSGEIESIIPYVEGTTSVLITASDDALYVDDTANSLTELATGFSNARWEYVKLGANMILVNGADAPRNYDGSSLTTPSFTGDLNTYGPTNIDNAHKHKNRVYLWNTDDNVFFYGGVNAVAGAFTEFPLGNVSDTGGNLIEMKTISRDGGNGPDDYACFILDTGEIIIYQGSDPGDATNWSLVGKYKAPPIIAKRCAAEFAGDIFILTQQDLVKVSDVIRAEGFILQPSKLSGAITDFYKTFGSNFGFSLTLFAGQSLIVLNMPQVTNATYTQYAINTVTGAATQFSNLDFNVFGVLDNKLYGGGDQVLYSVLSGFTDDGLAIEATARQAFSDLGSARKKQINAATQFLEAEGELNLDFSLSYDFTLQPFSSSASTETIGADWDVAAWDEPDWAGAITAVPKFILNSSGYNFSPQMRFSVAGQEVTWYEGIYNFKLLNTYP